MCNAYTHKNLTGNIKTITTRKERLQKPCGARVLTPKSVTNISTSKRTKIPLKVSSPFTYIMRKSIRCWQSLLRRFECYSSILSHCFHRKCTCPFNKSSSIIYSHICHSSPIATFCYILLSDFLALVFALISLQGANETVWNRIIS